MLYVYYVNKMLLSATGDNGDIKNNSSKGQKNTIMKADIEKL